MTKRHHLILFALTVLALTAIMLTPNTALAQDMNSEDAYMLGMSAELAKDWGNALKWFRMSAEQGHDMAQFSLGDLYFRGDGVEQNYPEALKWYLMAAEQDNVYAQLAAGAMYANGNGTEQDYAEAVRWFRQAAVRGNAYAQFNMGIAYDNGLGVQQDRKQAFDWFMKAARGGIADAQFNVGILYAAGEGVEQDPVESYRWINKAAEQGHPQAIAARAELETILTPAQINLGRGEGPTAPPSGPVIQVPDFKPVPQPEQDGIKE